MAHGGRLSKRRRWGTEGKRGRGESLFQTKQNFWAGSEILVAWELAFSSSWMERPIEMKLWDQKSWDQTRVRPASWTSDEGSLCSLVSRGW